jgi:type I restriction enzyme R subunit
METTSEAALETAIEAVLVGAGYTRLDGKGFDRERAIFPDEALAFIQATQAKVWGKLEALHGTETGARVLEALCKWLDTHGTLDTLRHGFKCFGKTLRIAFFRRAHGLTLELEARYQANRLGLTRQLHLSARSEQSLDVALSVNGIPVLSLELKNSLSGQTVADAIQQYRHDRDPCELIFAFTKRALVHFAVGT